MRLSETRQIFYGNDSGYGLCFKQIIMERQTLLCADYLDILFDGRNKIYGGYELRRMYAVRARKAAAAVILSAALIVTLPVIAASIYPDKKLELHPVSSMKILADIHNAIPKPLPVKFPEPPAVKATEKFPPLKVVVDEDVPEPPKTVKELSGKEIGLRDNSGSLDGVQPDLGGPVGESQEIVEQPITTAAKTYVAVEQMPQFNGDLSAFLSAHLRYPEASRIAGETGRVGLRFVVNEDGAISDVEVIRKATPLLDAEALRIVSSMPRWKPGRQGGMAVKVYFTLPVIFQLD